jgi:hypothetical protein
MLPCAAVYARFYTAVNIIETLLVQMIDDEGGPLIWPRISETEQKALDTTSRKLYRFLLRVQEP